MPRTTWHCPRSRPPPNASASAASTSPPAAHCGNKGGFTEPKQFSGLLSTHLGPTQDTGSV
ncbi:hypothetical protein AB0K09_32410, partial [Streptomyces sp. NPDC049577]